MSQQKPSVSRFYLLFSAATVFVAVLMAPAARVLAATVSLPAGVDIQSAVNANPAGTTFNLAAGVYSMQQVQVKDGDSFIGTLGALGVRQTILSGAQALQNFSQDANGNWIATTTQITPGQQNGQCLSGYRCDYPEDLIIDNQALSQVENTSSIGLGQFYFDYPNGTIYFKPFSSGDNPNSHVVEYSRTRSAFLGSASNVTIRNLVVEKYAVPDQFGAIGDQYPGSNWTIDNVEAFLNHGAGVNLGAGSTLTNSYIHDNGQKGISGGGSNVTIINNVLAHNVDYTHTDCSWECGGGKFVANGIMFIGNSVHDNTGPGFWADVNSTNITIESSTFYNNSDAGIKIEISSGGTVRNNVLKNDGAGCTSGWPWCSEILLQNSSGINVFGNVVVINATGGDGIAIISQNRADSTGAHLATNDHFYNNSVTLDPGSYGFSGAVTDYNNATFWATQATTDSFDYDVYHDTNTGTYNWHWQDNLRLFPALQSLGVETHGLFDGTVNASDVTPPSGTVTVGALSGGSSGGTIAGTAVPLSVSASDNAAVGVVQFFVDGAMIGTPQNIPISSSTPINFQSGVYSIFWDSTTVADGPHVITAEITDANGNSAMTAPLTITVHNAAPPTPPQTPTSTPPTPTPTSTPPTPTPAPVSSGGGGGGSGGGSSGGSSIPALTAPSNLSIAAISSSSVQLSWSASTGSSIAGYHVWRNEYLISTATGTVYKDSGLEKGFPYSYAVSAYSSNGNNSARSATVSITLGTSTVTPPTVVPPVVSIADVSSTVTVAVPLTLNLGIGSTGTQVSALQKFLAQDTKFYPQGLVTGYFGSFTRQAIETFQKSYGIVGEYGVVGPQTRTKIALIEQLQTDIALLQQLQRLLATMSQTSQ
jgi:parallel beta-helix repeat protein